jgi:hypothetical protein
VAVTVNAQGLVPERDRDRTVTVTVSESARAGESLTVARSRPGPAGQWPGSVAAAAARRRSSQVPGLCARAGRPGPPPAQIRSPGLPVSHESRVTVTPAAAPGPGPHCASDHHGDSDGPADSDTGGLLRPVTRDSDS